MEIKKSINEIYDVLDKYVKSVGLTLSNEQQVKKLLSKLTDKAIGALLKNAKLTFYVSNVEKVTQQLYLTNIKDSDNKMYVYLIYKLIEKENLQNSMDEIIIEALKYNKFNKEVNEFINKTLNLVEYTTTAKGTTIDIEKLDEIYTCEHKDIAKGARKSAFSTLTEKTREKTFRVTEIAKKRIVEIDELESRFLNLKDKHISLRCPVCNDEHVLESENIDKILSVKASTIQFICAHLKSKFIDRAPFIINLENYFKSDTKKLHKQMFLINNFKKLIEKNIAS